MKTNKIIFTLFAIVLCTNIALITACSTEQKPSVDLPEEWPAITTNEAQPDTLVCYKKGNTLMFGFTGKHR